MHREKRGGKKRRGGKGGRRTFCYLYLLHTVGMCLEISGRKG